MRVQENQRDISMGFRPWRRVVLQLDTNVSKQPADSIFRAEENLQDVLSAMNIMISWGLTAVNRDV
jgi:hypothetical protein